MWPFKLCHFAEDAAARLPGAAAGGLCGFETLDQIIHARFIPVGYLNTDLLAGFAKFDIFSFYLKGSNFTGVGRPHCSNDPKIFTQLKIAFQNFTANDGAFVSYTPFGNTDDYLMSLNISSDLPYLTSKIPLKLFFNTAYFAEDENVPAGFELNSFAWEGGVKLSFFGNNIEIFLPLIMSEGLTSISDDFNDQYLERIRFTFNLNNLNPIKILDKNLM